MHARTHALGALLVGIGVASIATITACGDEPDVTGGWSLHLSPSDSDAGVTNTIPGDVTIDAQLEQGGKTDFLGLGHYVYGTLTASDADYFGALAIPRLLANDGSKTGAVLGCQLRINVPVAMSVSDDNLDQGPLRLTLIGQITHKGVVAGVLGSRVIISSDPTATPRDFAFSGVRR